MKLIFINIFSKIKVFLLRALKNEKSIENTSQEPGRINQKKIPRLADDIDIEEINKLTDNVAKSRYKDVSYENIRGLAEEILKIPKSMILRRNDLNYRYSISKEESIKITLEFFKELDNEFYEKAKKIIEGKDENISINIFKVLEYDKNNYDLCKKYEAKMEHIGKKKKIYIPLEGNINDIYAMVHEISHTFDAPQELNLSRVILADVNSECFERMLDDYLENSKSINEELKKDVVIMKEENLIRTYYSSLEYIIKYSFFDFKNYNGELTKEDIKKIMSRFFLPPSKVVAYLGDNLQDINFALRYILGGIAGEEFFQIYKKNPKVVISKMKRYMEKIKEDKGIDALKVINVKMDENYFKKAVEDVNKDRTKFSIKEQNENLRY